MKIEPISSQEEFILLAIAVLQPESYAYSIQNEVKSEFNHYLALGSIHTALYRLEKRSLLKSEMGGSNTKRGGRSKRLYSLTNTGYELIQRLQQARQSIWYKIALANNN